MCRRHDIKWDNYYQDKISVFTSQISFLGLCHCLFTTLLYPGFLDDCPRKSIFLRVISSLWPDYYLRDNSVSITIINRLCDSSCLLDIFIFVLQEISDETLFIDCLFWNSLSDTFHLDWLHWHVLRHYSWVIYILQRGLHQLVWNT